MDVRLPDGTLLKDVPDGTTKAELVGKLQRNGMTVPPEWMEAPAPQAPTQQDSAPIQMVKNIPASAGRFVGGIANAVMSPLDTAKSVLDLGAGALRNVSPQWMRSALDALDTSPESMQAAENASSTASAAGAFYKNRYGGLENVKKTVVEDPVGVAADLSTVLGIGGGLAGAARAQGLAGALGKASKYTNPLSVVPPTVKAAGVAGKNLAGLLTGVGAENVSQAARSGFKADPAFIENLSGKTSMTDVLTQAKEGLQNMRADRSAAYKGGIASTAADTTKLNFTPIDNALSSVTDSLRINGKKWLIGKDEVAKVKELDNVVREWRIDPTLHTPIGLDALKRRLDALYPDSPRQNQAQRAITNVRNAVKDTIVKQSPEYAQTMAGYETALGLEKEIERALSLNNKASADTALRKLQSLSRNNVNTNYGNRLGLAQALEDQGGVSLLPSIAGQAMNSWAPRGAFGQGTTTATLGASYFNPAAASLLPLQSPKAVGLTTYGGGRVAGILARALEKAGVSPDRARNLGLLGYQLGQEREGQ